MDIVKYFNALPGATYEDKVAIIGKQFLQEEQVEVPVTHTFGPGIYIRSSKMPAGCFAIGRYNRLANVNILLSGSCTIVNEDGSTKYLKAPLTFVAEPGRKVGYIHEDMEWLNIYATEERDIAKLEEMIYDSSKTDWADISKVHKNLLQDYSFIEESRKDFLDVIQLLGFTAEEVQKISEYEGDQIPFPIGQYKVIVGESQIEGRGLFATGGFKAGETICPMRVAGKRTPAGRYTNHSILPNAKIEVVGEDIYLVAVRNIQGATGGFKGEELTIDYYTTFKESR